MSYFSSTAELARLGVEFDDAPRPGLNGRGCTEPTHAYGESRLPRLEAVMSAQGIKLIPREEWPERIEYLERNRSALIHRIDADWEGPLYQGRLGWCWSYCVAGALQAADARDGRVHIPLSAASVAAQIKNGRDEGGWPVDAAEWIEEYGIPPRSMWGDCHCKGRHCKGPRSGCEARDLSRVEATREIALQHRIAAFAELPRNSFDYAASCVLQGLPVAGGWVRQPRTWCNGHAMLLTTLIRTSRGGYQLLPDNSWGKYKRRVPVGPAPTGGVVVLRSRVVVAAAENVSPYGAAA